MIIKLQKPLFVSAGQGDVLVYNEGRTFTAHIPLTRALDALFGLSVKMYCEARLTKERRVLIERRVADQFW
jgi:hypothetical protein